MFRLPLPSEARLMNESVASPPPQTLYDELQARLMRLQAQLEECLLSTKENDRKRTFSPSLSDAAVPAIVFAAQIPSAGILAIPYVVSKMISVTWAMDKAMHLFEAEQRLKQEIEETRETLRLIVEEHPALSHAAA